MDHIRRGGVSWRLAPFRNIAAALLGLLAAGAASAATPAGEVLAFSGQCFVEADGRRSPLKNGDAVNVGDTVDVPQGGKLRLRMKDGSVISAASGTRMTIDAFEADAQRRDAKLSLVAGLVRAVVAAVTQPSRFEVDTATGVAAVRSTDWFVEAAPDTTRVGVLDGTVSLTSAATRKEITIPARWGARVDAGRNSVPARLWTKAEFDDVIARTNVD
jgi:hypothetical protein